jgi:hypothetical protein
VRARVELKHERGKNGREETIPNNLCCQNTPNVLACLEAEIFGVRAVASTRYPSQKCTGGKGNQEGDNDRYLLIH